MAGLGGAVRYEGFGTERARAYVVFPRDRHEDRLISVTLAEEQVAECMLTACRRHGAGFPRMGLIHICTVVRASMRGGASHDSALEEAWSAAAAWCGSTCFSNCF